MRRPDRRGRWMLVALMGALIVAPCAQASDSQARRRSIEGVPDPAVAPYLAVGLVVVEMDDDSEDWCSGTAINSPSRELVLTAGHCLYEKQCTRCRPISARRVEFIPALSDGRAPYGTFIARSWQVPQRWRREWFNDAYDVGAIRLSPNERGQNVADAVGGGIPIALDQPRKQTYQLIGYPGNFERMHQCEAQYDHNDPTARFLSGPPPLGVGCYMGDGASGGPWLINGGTEIDGLTSYSIGRDKAHTYGPYFSQATVGSLVAGL